MCAVCVVWILRIYPIKYGYVQLKHVSASVPLQMLFVENMLYEDYLWQRWEIFVIDFFLYLFLYNTLVKNTWTRITLDHSILYICTLDRWLSSVLLHSLDDCGSYLPSSIWLIGTHIVFQRIKFQKWNLKKLFILLWHLLQPRLYVFSIIMDQNNQKFMLYHCPFIANYERFINVYQRVCFSLEVQKCYRKVSFNGFLYFLKRFFPSLIFPGAYRSTSQKCRTLAPKGLYIDYPFVAPIDCYGLNRSKLNNNNSQFNNMI